MLDDNYLEKILGEQYNMSNYFENTYTDDEINEIEFPKKIEESDKKDKTVKTDQKEKKTLETNIDKGNKLIDGNSKKEKSEEQEFEKVKVKVNTTNVDTKEEKAEDRLKKLYPDIFNVLEPIVELVVKNHSDKKEDEELVKKLTDKIYYAVEATNNDDTMQANTIPVGKRHDGKRPKNNLLHDLIKILIINNMLDKKHKCHRI